MIRRCLATLLLAGGIVLGAGTVPAFAEGPPVPPGCTFDSGVRTCVTKISGNINTLGSFNTGEQFVQASNVFGGLTGTQICDLLLAGQPQLQHTWTSIRFRTPGESLTERTTTTTTDEGHGLHGEIFGTSTSTVTTLTNNGPGFVDCGY
jgi:hypothetical protein